MNRPAFVTIRFMTKKERFKIIPAVFVLLRRGDNVLLLRRANTGYQDGKYSLIAGHLDGDELATEAAVREAKEEAGITVDPSKLDFVHVSHRLGRGNSGDERIDLFYELKEWQGEITNAEPHKCDDLSWHPLNDLPGDTLPHVRRVLECIKRSIPYSEYITEPVD